MEQQLKQRLVGVGVIFALAIIFLPLLLDGSGRRPENLNVVIPTPPEISSNIRVEEKIIELDRAVQQIPVLEPVFIDEVNSPPDSTQTTSAKKKIPNVNTVKSGADKSVPDQAKVIQPKEPATPEKQTGGESWVIQMGSFSDKKKAYQFRDKLRNSKLSSVFIEQYKHQGSTRYRVRMGPFILQKKAKVVQNKVRAKYDVNGLVMRYEK